MILSTTNAPPLDLERAEKIAFSLAAAVANRRIYAKAHQRTESACALVATLLGEFYAAGASRFLLSCSGGVLIHEGVPLDPRRGGLDVLAQRLSERDCGGLNFRPQAGRAEVTALVEWLAERQPRPLPQPPAGIEILKPDSCDGGAGDKGKDLVDLPEFRTAHLVHQSAQSVLDHVMDDARAHRKTDFAEILELTRWTSEEIYRNGAAILAPTQSRRYDSYTFNHSVNVFLIATTLLQPLARDPKELSRFAQAALLHDVGKSRVPREVLNKDGKLTDEEFALIRNHPAEGARILQESPHADPLAIEVAYCHHMRDDGHGYPVATWPVKCGPVTNVIHVADMFEALTAHRPYRDGLTAAQALEKILTAPGMASKRPAIRMLYERLTCSPPGSLVQLSTGERGLVLRIDPDQPERPLVRVFEDADGATLDAPYEIDLREAGPDGPSIAQVRLKPDTSRLG